MTQVEDPAPRNEPRGSRLWILLAAALLLGLLLGYVVIRLAGGQPLFGPAPYTGTVIDAPQPLPNFTLINPQGEEVSLADLRGEVVVLYYGYTFCPDICPTTMADLARAYAQLSEAEQEQLQVVMISVDPERDTPEVIGEYAQRFHPDFLGLTGTPEQIATAAAPAGIYYQKQAGSVATGYLVDHTTTVLALDRQGGIRLLWSFGTPPADIAGDLERLIRE